MREPSEPEWLDVDLVIRDEVLRSAEMKSLIFAPTTAPSGADIPRVIVQYWDSSAIPADVMSCITTWNDMSDQGFTLERYNRESARLFIANYYDERNLDAFDSCRHPAMQADYFRLCFIFAKGGIYIDADDEYVGGDLESKLNGDALKLHPLCYRISTGAMENPFDQMAEDDDVIFYVNNNPLLAPAGHPLVAFALAQATDRLRASGESRDVQGLVGPGNLTESLIRHARALADEGRPVDFEILRDWEAIALSKWELAYRSDNRNWRRWGQDQGPA